MSNIKWEFELGEYDCEIGEVLQRRRGKWRGFTYISGRTTDDYDSAEPAMRAVESAYRNYLEQKAALIGCKLVPTAEERQRCIYEAIGKQPDTIDKHGHNDEQTAPAEKDASLRKTWMSNKRLL